jgi:hypothetical protein
MLSAWAYELEPRAKATAKTECFSSFVMLRPFQGSEAGNRVACVGTDRRLLVFYRTPFRSCCIRFRMELASVPCRLKFQAHKVIFPIYLESLRECAAAVS